jgi:hypothetical protein
VGSNDTSMLRRAVQRAEEERANTNIVLVERDNDTLEALKESPFMYNWFRGQLQPDAADKPVLVIMLYM